MLHSRARVLCLVLAVAALGGAVAGLAPAAGGEALSAADEERLAENEGLGLAGGANSEAWVNDADAGGISGDDGASTVFAESAAEVTAAAAGEDGRERKEGAGEEKQRMDHSALRQALAEKSRRVSELEAELRHRDNVASLSGGGDAGKTQDAPTGYMPSSPDADKGAMKPFAVSRTQGSGDSGPDSYVDPVIVPSLDSGSDSGSDSGISEGSDDRDAARPSAARNELAASRCGARRGIDWLVQHHLDLDLAARADDELMFELMFVAGRSADDVLEQVEVVGNAVHRLKQLRTRLRKVATRKAADEGKEDEDEDEDEDKDEDKELEEAKEKVKEEEVEGARERADIEATRDATEKEQARDRRLAHDAEERERLEAAKKRQAQRRKRQEEKEREEALAEQERAQAALEKAKEEADRRLEDARTEAEQEKEEALEAFESAKEKAEAGE